MTQQILPVQEPPDPSLKFDLPVINCNNLVMRTVVSFSIAFEIS